MSTAPAFGFATGPSLRFSSAHSADEGDQITLSAAADLTNSPTAYSGQSNHEPNPWLKPDLILQIRATAHQDTDDDLVSDQDVTAAEATELAQGRDETQCSNFRQTNQRAMIAHLILHWLQTRPNSGQNTHSGQPDFVGDSAELRQQLRDFIGKHQQQFQRIYRLPNVFEDRFAALELNPIRDGLHLLEDTGYIEFNYHENHSGPFDLRVNRDKLPAPTTLNTFNNADTAKTLEEILLSNAAWSDRAVLQLLQDFDDGTLKPGQVIAKLFYVGGKPLSQQVRTRALQRAVRRGMLTKQILRGPTFDSPTDTVFVVNDMSTMTTAPDHVPNSQSPHSNVRILLSHLTANPFRLMPLTPLAPSTRLSPVYGGGEDHLRTAARKLVKAGVLSEPRPGKGKFIARRDPASSATLVGLIKNTFAKRHRHTEETLLKFNNDLKSHRFNSLSELSRYIPFSHADQTDKCDDSLRACTRVVLQHLSDDGPLKLMSYSIGGSSRQSWLNPNVNFDGLSKTLAQINTQPDLIGAGAYYDFSSWQMPRLYQSHTAVKPSLWITPKYSDDDEVSDYDIQFGLVSTDKKHTFTPLKQLPDRPVIFDAPANKPTELSSTNLSTQRPIPFNKHRYARYYLDKLLAVYPLDALEGLDNEQTVTITAQQAAPLKQLASSFAQIGYQINL